MFIAIKFYVISLISKPLILKTSTSYEIHILLVVSVTVDIYSMYILYKANMFFKKLVNIGQLDLNIIHLLLS